MEQLQYPVGRFSPKDEYSTQEINQLIKVLETTPARYEQLLANRSQEELAKTYRPGSWTVQQLVHHVADIQLLNFVRMKKAVTESDYVMTTVLMDAWAQTADATDAPIQDSLVILDGVTRRFVILLRSLDESTLGKTVYHPVRNINLSLTQALYMATWHVAHHQGHIELAFGLQPNTLLTNLS
ncbi:bacillithiol transferase BstA [Spirosoma knui]